MINCSQYDEGFYLNKKHVWFSEDISVHLILATICQQEQGVNVSSLELNILNVVFQLPLVRSPLPLAHLPALPERAPIQLSQSFTKP